MEGLEKKKTKMTRRTESWFSKSVSRVAEKEELARHKDGWGAQFYNLGVRSKEKRQELEFGDGLLSFPCLWRLRMGKNKGPTTSFP